MRKIFIIIGIFILTAGAVYLLQKFPSQNEDNKELAEVEIEQSQIEAEVVRDNESKSQGLSGRPYLETGKGMLFLFEPADSNLTFWMDGMQFDLDIVWIEHDRIIRIDRNVPHPGPDAEPEILKGPQEPISAVLEVGAFEAVNWEIGHEVRVSY